MDKCSRLTRVPYSRSGNRQKDLPFEKLKKIQRKALNMRKKSREMSAEWALGVFDKAPFITVSMASADGNPYGLPLSLVRTDEKTFWFHCATEGKKLDVLKANPRVFLSAVTRCRPLRGPKDGSFTLEFHSATAVGTVDIVEDENTRKEALRAICMRFLPHQMEGFEEAVSRSLQKTAVVRITLTEPPVGKRKQYDANGDEMKYGRME